MKLKKLIILGFKSFADKVTLTFDDGITGIVGPNGSGKSNVIDAVRWVMGEQSAKHLRGHVATDIIFAGSDKRKPLGMAEVTLVFDNSDFSELCPPEYRSEPEIALTRRLYKDGQREYFINKRPSRLKDIVGFFTLTGLGGRSYSMIQQGQVDRILSAKPEDIRIILEEAAGTLIYKTRRDAAAKKLLATNENLSRIDDIISELERQVEALASQAEKARVWKELSEDLRERETKLFVQTFLDLKKKLAEIEDTLGGSEEREVELFAEIAELEKDHAQLQVQLAAADPELETLRERVAEIREGIARSESRITAAFQAIEDCEKRFADLDEDAQKDQEDYSNLEEIIRSGEREISLGDEEKARLQDQLEVLQDELERVEESAMVFRSREDQVKDELKNLEVLLESNAVRSEAVERDRNKASQEISTYSQRTTELEASIEEARSQVVASQSQLEEARRGLDEEVQTKQEQDELLRQLNLQMEELQSDINRERQTLIAAETRCDSLKEILEATSDIGEALNSLENAEGDVKSIYAGLLRDVIALEAGSDLPPAMLAAFDAWSERVLVRDSEGLNRLLDISTRHKLPRLPISLLGNKVSPVDVSPKLKPLAPLLKVIDAESGAEQVLRRLYYVDDSDLSSQLIADIPTGVTAFTSGGLVVHSEADLVLESKGAKGALARKREVEELLGVIEDQQQKIEALTQEIQARAEEKELLGEDIRRLEGVLQSQNETILTAVRENQGAQQALEHKEGLLEEARRQHDHYQTTLELLSKELEQLGEARIAIGSERESLADEVDGMQDQSMEVGEQMDEVKRQCDAKSHELVQVDAKLQARVETLAQQKTQLERMSNTVERRSQERERLQASISQAQTDEGRLAEEIQGAIAERESLEAVLQEKREENAGIIGEIKKLETGLKGKRDEQARQQKLKANKGLEVERLKLSVEGVKERAFDTYEINLEDHVQDEIDEEFNLQKVSGEIKKLRSKIEGLGAINMLAIEEYEKLTERSGFIQSQREEVVSSIELLEEAISEIEETAVERFLKVFEKINENFAQLFPILFPGGDARLHLTEEDDPFAGGVDILVRLPGKKARSMSLFSGGEKALTAISLIFALLKTKPTPFCFLDEVDAPLDEANVGRYNKVLNFLAERFQFVVITHNRRTMEVLDQLYGVTMQEGGVSKVVGVDLKKDLPKHLQKSFQEATPG